MLSVFLVLNFADKTFGVIVTIPHVLVVQQYTQFLKFYGECIYL